MHGDLQRRHEPVEGNIDPGTTTEGVKRTLHLDYPSAHQHTGLRRSVLVEIGTRGGTLPYVRRPMQSLIAISDLAKQEVDLLVREVEQHSKAAGLASIGRPVDGFATNPAWNLRSGHIRQAYDDVITRLVWPNTEPSTFEECCQRVHEAADLL